MTLIIDGIDVSKNIQFNGVTKGVTYRNQKTRITIEGKRYNTQIKKHLYTVTFDPMSEKDLKTLVPLLNKDYVSIIYLDPVEGRVESSFIPTIGDVSLVLEDQDGVSYWSGLILTLEEQ